MTDLIIRNCRLRHGRKEDRERIVDIAIDGGNVRDIGERLGAPATTEIDAGGHLVTPSFVNPHMHLCKVWTLAMMSDEALNAYQKAGMSGAAAAIALASEVKKNYHASWIVK